jgi:hypothetical protein
MLLASKVVTVTLGRIGARQRSHFMTNETEKNSQQSNEANPNNPQHKNNPQQGDIRRPGDVSQDPTKKAPGQDFDRKDREGSEDVEKRRAS